MNKLELKKLEEYSGRQIKVLMNSKNKEELEQFAYPFIKVKELKVIDKVLTRIKVEEDKLIDGVVQETLDV